MIAFSVITCVVVAAVILCPFFIGKGGYLVAAASENSEEKLQQLKKIILHRYLQDELAFKLGEIGKRAWQQRQQFLTNRYVDATQRLDFLTFIKKNNQQATPS